jgi:hypothetical protein
MQLLDAFTVKNPNGQKPEPQADPAQADQEPTKTTDQTDQEPTKTTDQTDQEPDARAIAGAEVVFKTTLRRLAGVEADGVLERRNKPEKMAAWLDTMSSRIREELRESAQATGRDIDQFAANWAARSRELLLECHRSGAKYEVATEGWCDKHL